MNPTRIYCDPIVDLIQKGPCDASCIHAIFHVTGGGLSNLLRLHDSLGWHIDSPLPVLEEFSWIQEMGSIEIREMYRTFNMGMGMVIAVSEEVSESVLEWVSGKVPGSAIVGRVTDNGRVVTHLDPAVRFDTY